MSLPSDIIREIFSLLDFKTQLTITPLVSKQWDNEIASLLGSRCTSNDCWWSSSTELYLSPRKLRPANALSYARAVERSLFSHITHVIFSRSYEADPIVVKALLDYCPNIRHFEFNTFGDSNPFALLTPWPQSYEAPPLTSIKFFRSQTVSTEMIESMTTCLPSLKSVWFYKAYCRWQDIDFLEQYIEYVEYDSTGDDWTADWYKGKRDDFWAWSQEPSDEEDDDD